jgi:membrane protease YdiL (CAAX protease family)
LLKPFLIFVVALLIRLVVVQIWTIPRLVYIPLELLLITGALYLEKKRLGDFFLVKPRLKQDLLIGIFLGVFYCIFSWIIGGLDSGFYPTYRIDTLLIVPVGVLLSGWRAGVYEELLFRSLAMGYLRRYSPALVAVSGQALLFYFAHARYFDEHHHWGLETGIFGFLLGWLAYFRRSVIPGMVIHALSNSYGAATLPPAEYIDKALRSWL